MKRFACGVVTVLAACLGMSTVAHATAALEAGAATSAKPTATNAVKRQMQIAADPVGITDFQFTLEYDPAILHVANNPLTGTPLIDTINGYVLGVRGNPEAAKFYINSDEGYVTVRGFWPESSGPLPFGPEQHVDVYEVMFELNEGIPVETKFTVNSLGVRQLDTRDNPFAGRNDFMLAGDIRDGRLVVDRTYEWEEILPATTGLVSIAVPAPTASAAVMPAVAILLRRKRQEVAA